MLALVELPSSQHIEQFYESEAYRAWRELRHKSAKTSIAMTL